MNLTHTVERNSGRILNIAPQDISLTPPELKAIEDRKFYMTIEQGKCVSITEAIKDFFLNYYDKWEETKIKEDQEEQKRRIQVHKFCLSKEKGYDVGEEFATLDWITNYAGDWRIYADSFKGQCGCRTAARLKNKNKLDCVGQLIATTHSNFGGDTYIHSKKFADYDLTILERKFSDGMKLFFGGKKEVYALPEREHIDIVTCGTEAERTAFMIRRMLER